MNKKYILFFLFGLLSITISAQSLAEAKALYEKGEYEEAKPTFKKLVKTQPGNGNYNLWYGVCCLETGEPAEARGARRRRSAASTLRGRWPEMRKS